MGNFLSNFATQCKQLVADIKNKKKFKQEILLEKEDPKSKFNEYGLSISTDGFEISAMLDLPEEFQIGGTDMDKFNKLKELSYPITQYICMDLQWAEYFYMPSFYSVEDPTDTNGESRTYLAIWEFAPIVYNDGVFWAKFTAIACGMAAIVGGIIAAIAFI